MPQPNHPSNPLPCGCAAVSEMHYILEDRVHYIHVRFCPLHQAAGELLEACETFAEAWEKSHQLEKTDVAVAMARAAIAKARGKE